MNTGITEEALLQKMAAYCADAERCVRDVENRLKRAGAEPPVVERIVSRLQAEKFLDEERYCRFFVQDRLRFNKWGRLKLLAELRKKGISSAACENALQTIDAEEYRHILLQLLEAKKRSTRGKDEREVFQKLLRFAAGRGFEPGLASECLRGLFRGGEYGGDME